MAENGHCWSYLAIFGHWRAQLVATLLGLNTSWTGLNIVSRIWRKQSYPFGPIKNGPMGLRGSPQKAIFGQIWQYLAIDGPSWPVWAEHQLNRIEHCISNIEGPVAPLWTHGKSSLGSHSGGPKTCQLQNFAGCAKYGCVGYHWKDHTKWSTATLTSGR